MGAGPSFNEEYSNNKRSALRAFVELRLRSQSAKWQVLRRERKEGRALIEDRLIVRNKFVGMEETAINAIWNKYDKTQSGYLSRSSIKTLLLEYMREVHMAIPRLVSNSFRQRMSETSAEEDTSSAADGTIEAFLNSASTTEQQKKREEIKLQQEKVSEMIAKIDHLTDDFIRKMDSNNDGKVERGEFVKTFRTLLYTTADKVDLNPAEEIKIDKEDESFFFDNPVDHIKMSAPRQNFMKAKGILKDLAKKANIDLKAQLQTVLQLLEGVDGHIVIREEDILKDDSDFAELIRMHEENMEDDDDQALDYVTHYIPKALKLRETLRSSIGDTLPRENKMLMMLNRRAQFTRAHSYSMPTIPSNFKRKSAPYPLVNDHGSPSKSQKKMMQTKNSKNFNQLLQMAAAEKKQLATRAKRTARERADTGGTRPIFSLKLSDLAPGIKTSLKKVNNWEEFDIFELDKLTHGNSLLFLTSHVMEEFGMLKGCGIVKSYFAEYISLIQGRYKDNPYHNRVHVADVVQAVNYFLSCEVGRRLPHYLRFAAIFAGATHDVSHPGTTNTFQINTQTKLAYLYNDSSVLENMHLSEAFLLLKKTDYKILRGLRADEKDHFRKAVIEMVLATDMSKHGAHTHAFATQIVKKERPQEQWCVESRREEYKDDVRLFLNTVIHAADLANTARPLHLCKEWVKRLYTEFYSQGDKERKLGLKVSPLCDRNKPAGAKGQVFFISKIVIPMFASFYMLVPEVKVCMQCLERNLSYWSKEAEKEAEIRSRNSSVSPASPRKSFKVSNNSVKGFDGRKRKEKKKIENPISPRCGDVTTQSISKLLPDPKETPSPTSKSSGKKKKVKVPVAYEQHTI
mmetsp:Transcript_18564/g.27788  ORF Transcript_18564/g.27788 Transcript_18564/m.27788 type:complete len:855 (+) Transcript_18564:249-2813(+)